MSAHRSAKALVSLFYPQHAFRPSAVAKDGLIELYEVKPVSWPESALWQPAYDFREQWREHPDEWVFRVKPQPEKALAPVPAPEPAPAPEPLDETLAQRKQQYGDFGSFALLVQHLKTVVRNHRESLRLEPLQPLQQEGIDMILHKIGRIVNGNPDNVDSWVDVAGYATCVAQRLPASKEPDASRP